MALDKNCKDYYYNLGRCVTIVEIMNNLPRTFRSLVFDNAFDKLPYQLNAALANDKHNLHKELLPVAELLLANDNEFPKGMLTKYDTHGRYWIGIYHEQKYLNDTYRGVYGKEETTVEEYAPAAVTPEASNDIDDLRR